MSGADLHLMRRIDALHLECPFAGASMLRDLPRQECVLVGRKHVAALMRKMGIEALYRRPNTSRKHPGHPIYPYLLRHLTVTRVNQVWAMDITYIPMARGFVYLAAVVDWHSRKVLSWRVSMGLGELQLWKSVKYEEVYLKAYNTVSEARTSLGQYFELYNRRRPH